MNWDDLRYVIAVSKAGSLLAAGKLLNVDHTTVGRRVEAAEEALGVRLFTRTRSGYVPTADADRLIAPMQRVEEAVLSVERTAQAQQGGLTGTVRITSPETFGAHYLASRLAAFQREHLGLTVELVPAGEVLDLTRREAELAIRTFRSRTEGLVLKRLATVSYGFYASPAYLKRRPVGKQPDLSAHPILSIPPTSNEVEQQWLRRLAPGVQPAFVSPVSSALQEAARASAGLAILPCYLGDADEGLKHIPMPEPPTETLWMTVHKDLRKTPRVRAVLDYLTAVAKEDEGLFSGAASMKARRQSRR